MYSLDQTEVVERWWK